MFQQFRFKENPEISLTFFENERTGDLEMEGRDDLKACDDQVFENNFWPAWWLKKKVKVGDEQTRFAMVPITNPDSGRQMAKDDEEISIDFDESSAGKFTLEKNRILFILKPFQLRWLPIREWKQPQMRKFTRTNSSRLPAFKGSSGLSQLETP